MINTISISIVIYGLTTFMATECVAFQQTSRHNSNAGDDFTGSPVCMSGSTQSPINIITSQVSNLRDGTVELKSYNRSVTAEFKNNGHGVTVKIIESPDLGLIINDRIKYILHSIHFHVGCTEHFIDGKSYDMELHAVHYNENWRDMNNAKDRKAGLSVLGVLFKETSEENEALNILLDMIRLNSSVRGLDKKILNYQDLFPSATNITLQYNGSLTTAPCFESVIWNVINETNYMSSRQLREFRRLQANSPNCRKTQPMNNRRVFQMTITGISHTGRASVLQSQSIESIILILLSLSYYRSIT